MNIMTGADYRKSLQRLSQRFGLNRFFDWWLGELSAMTRQLLPSVSKPSMKRWVLVKISGSLVTFLHVVHGKVTEVGRLDMASMDAAEQKQRFQYELNKIILQKGGVVLYLPQEQVLCKKLLLPLAAEENLRQVIAFEMDRYTPFNAEQVYFDYRLTHRGKQLEISMAIAPRDVIDEPLRQLAAWGAQAAAVLVVGDATDDTPWNLLPDGLRQKSKGMRLPYLNAALATGIAALLCAALALPIWQKRETVLALHPLLNKAREQAEAAEKLRRQLEAMMAEYNYLLDKKREFPPVVAVLEDVARVLPDDTWVQQFSLKGKEMQIHGETASSSKLVGLFEQAKTLHNANFRAPLTKGQEAGSERFQLAAEIRTLSRTETVYQTQSVDAKSAPSKAVAPSEVEAAASTLKEKDKTVKQPAVTLEAAKADSRPAVTKVETKPIPSPDVRMESKP